MLDIRLILAGTWICLMLTYLLGDVLRIFAGDYKPGMISGVKATQAMFLGISMMMVTPIIMIFLTLVLDPSINRVANIVVAGFFFLFNLVALPSYPGHYDKFLIAVGLVFNVLTIWYAWGWVA